MTCYMALRSYGGSYPAADDTI
ncbi:hypothetical protein BDFB_002952 [Asbolus verrucosus]|uniref:Uncharacterized protein n=1 Tax=Asbolus verrucosus TaxID=1661398 RepID=A0A482W628_ASBVE|nr:hypothetical protein BDFB_002952 [Asbolus verrucosus]